MQTSTYATTTLGYPRVGQGRAYKWILENFWAGKTDAAELEKQAAAREAEIWQTQCDAGIDLIPAGDFSLYDHVLDTAAMFGCIPQRYGWDGGDITPALYFALARGADSIPACEMTKWFDTNYHYLIPELPTWFQLTCNRPLETLRRAQGVLGASAKPWLLGPFTFLKLANLSGGELAQRLEELTPLYERVLRELGAATSALVQIDEPSLVTDVSDDEWSAFAACYEKLAQANASLCVQTYYGDVAPLWSRLVKLPVAALGVDLVAGRKRNSSAILNCPFPTDKKLVLGVVDGRNVWRSDLNVALACVQNIGVLVPAERLLISSSCPLWHLPETVADEEKLSSDLRDGLCFARERLQELNLLARALRGGVSSVQAEWDAARAQRQRWLNMEGRRVPAVRERVEKLQETDFQRMPLQERSTLQRERLPLPLLPTTTIGSFPQTKELRAARAQARENPDAYRTAIREEIARVVALQEEIGLDVLVHGEPERNDMVQFFAEQLHGFAATQHGWVQSYGSRCVRPPLIFGDVWREHDMTVELSRYAQSLTGKPMKGMLTGPVTMLQWSFVRDDLPRREVAYQIGLAIRDEVLALEGVGLPIIQIDEAAFREGLPLRRADWDEYLDWAVKAFRLTSSGVAPQTQIHTHMCYSEFSDIIGAIAALDADVISIEDARSYGEMLDTLREFQYPAGIGPGVYDIHSPNVPDAEAMADKIRRTLERLPLQNVWVNPDCGLKTRGYEETVPALKNMVEAAQRVRQDLRLDGE
jgi:5-methyltetrahydropteroyltriglutamate--homocysteine methyltransferase